MSLSESPLCVKPSSEASVITPASAVRTPMAASALFSIGKRKSIVPRSVNSRRVLAYDSDDDDVSEEADLMPSREGETRSILQKVAPIY